MMRQVGSFSPRPPGAHPAGLRLMDIQGKERAWIGVNVSGCHGFRRVGLLPLRDDLLAIGELITGARDGGAGFHCRHCPPFCFHATNNVGTAGVSWFGSHRKRPERGRRYKLDWLRAA